MPTTVLELLDSANLNLTGMVKWRTKIPTQKSGVYIVSLSNDLSSNSGIIKDAPLSLEKLQFWINKVPTIELDKKKNPKSEEILNRLSKFWLSDENIVYIGMTTAALSQRVGQYYITELGDSKPHAGGHWIKTLLNLNELYVYYAECLMPDKIEDNLLETFIGGVSKVTTIKLFNPERPFPFANLEYPAGNRKKHGIGKSKIRGN